MSVEVLGERVYVEAEGAWNEDADSGESALIVVEDSPELQVGTVLSVGDGRRDDGVVAPIELEVGDRVLFRRYAGTEHKRDHIFLLTGEVLAKVV